MEYIHMLRWAEAREEQLREKCLALQDLIVDGYEVLGSKFDVSYKEWEKANTRVETLREHRLQWLCKQTGYGRKGVKKNA